MSVRDDELDDDPMLRGMRSVWREMRDEEPPARGLDDLLAAARKQAAAMKPAEPVEPAVPWWRRMFAVMVRPPVLAAATVLVVIGGAIALKSRGADQAAEPIAKQRADDNNAEGAPRPESSVDTAIATPTVEAAPGTIEQAAPGGGDRGASLPPPPPPPAPAPSPDPPPPADKTVAQPRPDTANRRRADAPVKPTEKKPVTENAPSPPSPPSKPDMVIAKEDDEVEENQTREVSPRAPSRAPASDRPAVTRSVDRNKLGVTSGGQSVTTDKLIQQAQTAANRNDCAAVKVTVERIRKMDPDAYKTRVVTQPAIARCLK